MNSQQRNNKAEKIKDLLEYAKKQYGCEFPRDFHLMLSNLSEVYGAPKKKVIDAIFKEWKVWEKYVDKDSYNHFFQYEIETMFTLQTVSTFSSPVLRGYIGNKATIKENKELPLLATTVTWDGSTILNGKQL